MKTKTYDINKLPKWAKHELQKLRADVVYYKEKAQEIKGEKETNTYISQGIGDLLPLPKDSRIIFVVNPDRSFKTGQIQVAVKEDNVIEIYGNEQLEIKLQASNICYIKSRRD